MPSKITSDNLQELSNWGNVPGFEVLSNEGFDSGRWNEYYRLVWREDGVLYAYDYEVGLTEMQDAYNDWNVNDIYEVKPVEVTTVRYEKV